MLLALPMIMTTRSAFGIVGLGRMGGGLALRARSLGISVAGLDPHGLPPELRDRDVVEVASPRELARVLATPRIVVLYVPAGHIVDVLLDELVPVLSPGDVIADGGNSYWGDSIHRHDRLAARGIGFVDAGTSGGIEGARSGPCFMVGGARDAVEIVEPLFRRLAIPGGYVHAGPPGAGHFVKLVHNGIEFGMLQAIAEGLDLLEHHVEKLRVADVLNAWRYGSVIRSWLLDLLHRAYIETDRGARVQPYVEDTGEVNWLVADALRMERPIQVIAQAVIQLAMSRDTDRTWAKAIAMMRHGFGGHPYGADPAIRRERETSRVGDLWRNDPDQPDTASGRPGAASTAMR